MYQCFIILDLEWKSDCPVSRSEIILNNDRLEGVELTGTILAIMVFSAAITTVSLIFFIIELLYLYLQYRILIISSI